MTHIRYRLGMLLGSLLWDQPTAEQLAEQDHFEPERDDSSALRNIRHATAGEPVTATPPKALRDFLGALWR